MKYICVKDQRKVPGPTLRGLEIVDQGSKVTRLAKNVVQTGVFDPQALKLTEDTLSEMAQKMPKNTDFVVAATESARKVQDPKPLVDLVRNIFSKNLIILDGAQEAHLSSKGACAAAQKVWPQDDPKKTLYCFLEVGGGSAQFGYHMNSHFGGISIPFGAVTVFEKYSLSADGTSKKQSEAILGSLKNDIQLLPNFEEFKQMINTIGHTNFSYNSIRYLAIGGTLISTARALLDGNRSQQDDFVGYTTSLTTLREKVFNFASLSLKERLNIPKIDPTRADIMPAGLLLFLALAEMTHFSDPLLITGWGLRHGMALRAFEEKE